jgi:hypothetical protein
LAANPESKICHTEELWIRNGIRFNPAKNTPKEAAGYLLIAYCTVRYHPSGLMVHRSVFRDIGLFDTRLPVCED